MEYLHYFETTSAFTEAYNNEYVEPWISYTEENQQVNYNKKPEHDYTTDYLTFEILSDGYINWQLHPMASMFGYSGVTIEYSKNNGEWNEITSTSEGTHIDVITGDVVRFKGNNLTYNMSSFSGTTCDFNVYGNIMSLIYGDNFQNQFTLESANTFSALFYGYTGLTNANNLILPATTLAQGCYNGMFSNCTSLVTAPELPATTLVQDCYNGMFENCTSLVTAPVLPATTLTYSCYQTMFYGCTSLVTAPELPATTLAQSCYSSMFRGCTNLVTAPELPATTLAHYCYQNMFNGCTSLNYVKCLATDISEPGCTDSWLSGVAVSGTFVKAANMNDWTTGSNGIPEGWTVVDA